MKYSRIQTEFLLDRINDTYPAGAISSPRDMNSKFNGKQVEFLLDRVFDNLCEFNSSLLPYRKGQVCTFDGRKWEAVRDTSSAPLSCLKDKNNDFITTRYNEYIIVGGQSSDWKLFE